MKKLLIMVCFLTISLSSYAQETYTINSETLELKTEVDGALDLLWNIINSEYRYFLKDADGNIQELKNTKNEENKYQEEYKSVLKAFTDGDDLSVKEVNLTLFDLKTFLNAYNTTQNNEYAFEGRAKLKSRLGVFGGLTNSPFITNNNNTTKPLFGLEFEIFEQHNLPRHALFFRLRHTFKNNEFRYEATQLGLGYRFRAINKDAFSLYADVKLVTYTSSKNYAVNSTFTTSSSGTQVPFAFGLGADIRISEGSYITLAANELFALFVNNQGNFPVDIAIGYKFNL
jgi:hypothetical protein